MDRAQFTIHINFGDGVVRIGGDDELYIEVGEGEDSVLLNDERLNLIHLIQQAEASACE